MLQRCLHPGGANFLKLVSSFSPKNTSNEGVLIIKKISVRRGATVREVCMMLFLWPAD